ncbi:hypothetical protein JCM33374_g2331 [Metschnikowia sp. JCM 33374]|nr:hypothetical protein JCM33374_g2331 [Metschnikowia sp. JCM 33374]
MSQLQQQLESIPGFDLGLDVFNEIVGEHFNTKNPFEDKHGNKRVLDSHKNTEKERRVWKRVQKRAWVHDKCFVGPCGIGLDCSCCFCVDLGIGLVPLAVFFLPGIGPLVTYVIHARLIAIAQNELYLPAKLVAKLQSNILLDLLISLPPLVGAFLAWLNACSTRNAALIYTYLAKLGEKRTRGQAATYMGPLQRRGPSEPGVWPPQMVYSPGENPAPPPKSGRRNERGKGFGKKQPESKVVVGGQQSGFR